MGMMILLIAIISIATACVCASFWCGYDVGYERAQKINKSMYIRGYDDGVAETKAEYSKDNRNVEISAVNILHAVKHLLTVREPEFVDRALFNINTYLESIDSKDKETEMTIKYKRLHVLAKIPTYAHEGDSGMDVYAAEFVTILPHSYATIGTGIAAVIPCGYEIQVRPRSGLQCKHGIVGAFGTVDEGYRGEIRVALYNHSDCEYHVSVGDRIAQFVLAPVTRPTIEETDDLGEDTERGCSGFGSSGR